MTEQITFQYALKLLNQKEEDLLEQASQVRERKTQLIGALRFLGILDLLDFPKDPEEENEKNPEETSPESINHLGQTESDGQSSKPSPDFSSKTGPLQVDSIYERAQQQANQDRIQQEAYQQAYQEAMVEMRKGTLGPQTLLPDPKELLNAQGNNPSEWLLDRANARRDEIPTGNTTLQELLSNLDNLDGIKFNQSIIRNFLGGIFNSNSSDKEPDNSDPVEKINDHWNSLGSDSRLPEHYRRNRTRNRRPGQRNQGSDQGSDPGQRPGQRPGQQPGQRPLQRLQGPTHPRYSSDIAILYRDSKDPFIPYSNIKDRRPIPDSDISHPDSP